MAAPRNLPCHLISFLLILTSLESASAHRLLKETEPDTTSACAPEPSPSAETQASPCAPQASNADSRGSAGAGPQPGWGGPAYGAQGGIVFGFPGFGWPGIGIGLPPISIGGGPAGISIGGLGIQLGGGFYGGNICFTPGLGYSYCFTPGVIGGAVNGGGSGGLTYPPLTGVCGQTHPVSQGGQMSPQPVDCGQAQPVGQGGQVYPPLPDCGQAQPGSQGRQAYSPPAVSCGQPQPAGPGGQMSSNAAAPDVSEVSEEENLFN